MGIVVVSFKNSSISNTCVHNASLLSLTPNEPYIDRPLAQIPLKPTSSTTFAERPLWASVKNSSLFEYIFLKKFVLFSNIAHLYTRHIYMTISKD